MKTWNWQSFEAPGTLSLVLTQAYDETGTPCLCGPPNPGICFKGCWLVLEGGRRLVLHLMGISFTPSPSSDFLQNNSVSNQRSLQIGVDSEVTRTGLLEKDVGGFLSLRRSLA